MIKVDIKSDVLKETKRGTGIKMTCQINIDGTTLILEEEIYRLVKEFEKKIPEIWCNVIERVMTDALGGEEE